VLTTHPAPWGLLLGVCFGKVAAAVFALHVLGQLHGDGIVWRVRWASSGHRTLDALPALRERECWIDLAVFYMNLLACALILASVDGALKIMLYPLQALHTHNITTLP
jgi:hypothetical protein